MAEYLSPRDWQNLSEYLDGVLDTESARNLEIRLKAEPKLRQALDELRRTRLLLRSAPRLRAPRKFTLTSAMVGAKPVQDKRNYSALRLAFAFAFILLVAIVVGDVWSTLPMSKSSPETVAVMEALDAGISPNDEPVIMEQFVEKEVSPELTTAPSEFMEKAVGEIGETATPTASSLLMAAPPSAKVFPTATEESMLSMKIVAESPPSETPSPPEEPLAKVVGTSDTGNIEMTPTITQPTETPASDILAQMISNDQADRNPGDESRSSIWRKGVLGMPVVFIRGLEILFLLLVIFLGIQTLVKRKSVTEKK